MTDKQQAEAVLAGTSREYTASTVEQELIVTRAALRLLARHKHDIRDSDGMLWCGEHSIIEYYMNLLKNAYAKEQADKQVQEDRAYLLKTHNIAWDVLRQVYFDKDTNRPVTFTEVHHLLEARAIKKQMLAKAAAQQPTTMTLLGAIPSGQSIEVEVFDQFGRAIAVENSTITVMQDIEMRHYSVRIDVQTFSDDPHTRAAEEALARWLRSAPQNTRSYIETALASSDASIFLLHRDDTDAYTHIGIYYRSDTSTLPVRLFGMEDSSDTMYPSVQAVRQLVYLSTDFSLQWITEKH